MGRLLVAAALLALVVARKISLQHRLRAAAGTTADALAELGAADGGDDPAATAAELEREQARNLELVDELAQDLAQRGIYPRAAICAAA